MALQVFLAGCDDQKTLVVGVDTWMEAEARQEGESFLRSNPGMRIEWFVRPNAVIEQHIRYGHPVDLFYSNGGGLEKDAELEAVLGDFDLMGDGQLVWIEAVQTGKAREYKSEGCILLAASGSPLRDHSDEWIQSMDPALIPECRIYGNFFPQIRDYMLEGWVPEGLVFRKLVQDNPGLKIKEEGPIIPGLYRRYYPATGLNPDGVLRFREFLQSEK